MALSLTFDAALWRHHGEASWHFVTLPRAAADEIRDAVPPAPGFGSVRVTATLGDSTWQTSVFPEGASGSFVLPVKKDVRRRNDLEAGDTVTVTLVLGQP